LSEQLSLGSSSTYRAHNRVHSSKKGQRSLSHGKTMSQARRSERLQGRSKSWQKTKKERAKSKGGRPKHQETSSDSESEDDPKYNYEDLSTHYKRPKPTPLTTRITRFKYYQRAKLPRNIKVHEGNKYPEDHLSIFSTATELEEWSMPVWCKMFRQTLGGAYAKDPVEIHGIKRRHNEGLQAFMDRFKSESSHIKGVPPVLRISAFMYGHGHPERAKKFNDKIPNTVDEMFERVRAFIRGEIAAVSAEATRPHSGTKSQGNHERDKKYQNCATRICDSEMSLDLQLDNGKYRHEDSRSVQADRRNEKLMEGNAVASAHGTNVSNKGISHTAEQSHVRPTFQKGAREVIQKNTNIFSWTTMVNTDVPWFVMEHQLKAYPLAELVAHKKRPQMPDRRQALKEEVFNWLKEGIIRKVQMDYSSLHKVCAKDMYPFPEVEEEPTSLIGYQYKCFLRLPKGYSQIRMSESDEEKIRFHREEGVYCFCHMPKEIKNSTATLQRMAEKVLADQNGQNVELANINRFVPKLVELMHPIPNVRRSSDVVEGSN
ncbi:hypothetical protein Tco_1501016, partial [Tanacetum coccineum]